MDDDSPTHSGPGRGPEHRSVPGGADADEPSWDDEEYEAPYRRHSTLFRLVALTVAGALLLASVGTVVALVFTGGSTAPSGPGLPVTVTSVTAQSDPFSSAQGRGQQLEQVAFGVVDSAGQAFTCTVEVLHSGTVVGQSVVTAGAPSGVGAPAQTPPAIDVTTEVAISVAPFAGTPADAQVSCRA